MAKNTPKLTVEQRQDRKDLLKALHRAGGELFTFPEKRVAIVVAPALHNRIDSRFVHFTIAQCSEQDKFRVKVGQLVALERWYDGLVLPRVANDLLDDDGLEFIAGEIAEFFALE